jgi:hypothetical protein
MAANESNGMVRRLQLVSIPLRAFRRLDKRKSGHEVGQQRPPEFDFVRKPLRMEFTDADVGGAARCGLLRFAFACFNQLPHRLNNYKQ